MKTLDTRDRATFMHTIWATMLVALAAAPSLAASYSVLDLQTLPGTDRSSATALNDLGQVVGACTLELGSGTLYAFRTAPNSAINPITDGIGQPTGSIAYAINNNGQVAGSYFNSGYNRGFRTAPNAPIVPATDDLGDFGGPVTIAYGLNASGQTTGYSTTGTAFRSFRTDANSPISPTDNLDSLGVSHIAGINDLGQVIGYYGLAAFRTGPNQPINLATNALGSLGGGGTQPFAINNSGQVVGSSFPSVGLYHAFRTAANASINPLTDDLGTLGGGSSGAWGINAAGEVVGSALTTAGEAHAFIYDATGMHDLNELIPDGSGWTLVTATAINNVGQIAGEGLISGHRHAFLLTNIPEPGTLLLLMSAAVGLTLRRGRAA